MPKKRKPRPLPTREADLAQLERATGHVKGESDDTRRARLEVLVDVKRARGNVPRAAAAHATAQARQKDSPPPTPRNPSVTRPRGR